MPSVQQLHPELAPSPAASPLALPSSQQPPTPPQLQLLDVSPRLTESPKTIRLDSSPVMAPSRKSPHEEAVDRLEEMTIHDRDDTRAEDQMQDARQSRPHTPRHSTDSGVPYSVTTERQPTRNRSPYSRTSMPPQSSSGSLSAPPMTRAHSSPTFASPQFTYLPSARSQSPLRSPKRVRSPFRQNLEEPYPSSSAAAALLTTDIESISEDHELDITPRPVAPIRLEPSPLLASLQHGNTFPRARRRPASPLHQVSSASTPNSIPSTSVAYAAHSPVLSASRFNETFPSDLPYTRSFSSSSASVYSASVPSTPTSARSRSPSISSLETIPDTPDAEAAAIEAERLDGLKRGADSSSDGFRRGSLETDRGRSAGFGIRDKRKRWSVCGAEKRSDLNLETIWED